MLFRSYVFCAVVHGRINHKEDASLVVQTQRCRSGHVATKLLTKVSKPCHLTTSVRCSFVFCFSGRQRNCRLASRCPGNDTIGHHEHEARCGVRTSVLEGSTPGREADRATKERVPRTGEPSPRGERTSRMGAAALETVEGENLGPRVKGSGSQVVRGSSAEGQSREGRLR